MGKIILDDITVYAYHGAIAEENKIGSPYQITLELELNFELASKNDRLEDTFNYQIAYEIVQEEMKQKSKLLEHVGNRIIERIFEASEKIESVFIKVSKMNPPFGGNVRAVSIEMKKERE